MTTLADVFAMPTEQVDAWITDAETLLASHLDEAAELRWTEGLPDISLGSGEVLSRLASVRLRLDRVEVILAEVSRFRTGARVLFKESNNRADDRWAEHVAGGARPSRRGSFSNIGEVEGPRERYARADVAVLGDRVIARQRERLFDAMNDAVKMLEQIYRGLESVRFDLHAMLRLFSTTEHRLERTDEHA